MSEHISARLARRVRRRAKGACEYCKLPQWTQEATFHIDHIQPRVHGGATIAANLALACVSCSLKKASRTCAIDPKTKELVVLFHPRNHVWTDHFRWTRSWRVQGRTPTGRATIAALGINRPALVRIRRLWAASGKFRPAS